MDKHTQTIRLSVFWVFERIVWVCDHFVGLAPQGLKK